LDGQSLDKEKCWELLFQINSLELVVVEESSLFKMTELRRLYQPATSFSYPLLANIPLILLSPESRSDKAALWKKICLMLKK
jgi:hypothetical protein